ncbi:cornifelin homolog A-like [Convolutriloba macropyga]|uniref:cornifelin homolog A-like n=1 Tax=Convolutriloba macropyga TaxID=536237 RepID=UPI003F526E1C
MAEWKFGLFSCFGDMKICICGFFCPCILQGKVAEAIGEECLLYFIAFFIPIVGLLSTIVLRKKVREKKGIHGEIGWDAIASFCCTPCVLCQAANETDTNLMAAELTHTIDRV